MQASAAFLAAVFLFQENWTSYFKFGNIRRVNSGYIRKEYIQL